MDELIELVADIMRICFSEDARTGRDNALLVEIGVVWNDFTEMGDRELFQKIVDAL